MKTIFFIIVSWIVFPELQAQSSEQGPIEEEQFENLVEKTDAAVEDDSDWQKLNELRKNPIDLNIADEEDLESIGLLTDLQVKNFLRYRELLGKLISVYELQAIPSWNLEIIRQMLPYIIVSNHESLPETFRKRLRGGNNYLLLRISQVLEKSKGFEKDVDSSASYYLGSPQRILFRYTYNYKNMLQYGILGDKDAGEQFFKGYQRYGFDFYSFHFFARKAGIIRSLALGDFTVNMGQGLIQWQSLAFTKSAAVLDIKRQSPVLRPYHASGEFNFHRGIGISLHKGRWESTVFASSKKISANLLADTVMRQDAISSFENSGYHRTKNENADRNNIRQITTGVNINFSNRNWHIGINNIQYHFSKFIQKQDQPYNLFAIRGKSWSDYSADYSYTYHNFHFFGEAAIDRNGYRAFVDGVLVSLSTTIDAAILYRNIDKKYQSLYSDAFTENTVPNNEKGLYVGLSVHPFAGWWLDAFFDTYIFPWLKFRADAPGYGRDFFAKLLYQPTKKWYVYTCFKNEAKQANVSGSMATTHPLALIPKQNWRTEITVSINNRISLKSRVECVWYNRKAADAEHGFLNLIDIFFQPIGKLYNSNLSLQYFETSGYNSRLYVSEQDVLYSFSLPAYYSKGFRYYFKLSTNINRLFHLRSTFKMKLEGWLRWAQTIYPDKISMDSGMDQINGNKKSELKIQFMLCW